MTSSQHVYEVRPRKDKRGVDLNFRCGGIPSPSVRKTFRRKVFRRFDNSLVISAFLRWVVRYSDDLHNFSGILMLALWRKDLMRAGRPSRTRSRTSKFARRRRRSGKRSGTLRRAMMAHEETTDVERTPSLLLSSLRFWEVEHDLIEERLTAIRERQQRRLFAARSHA